VQPRKPVWKTSSFLVYSGGLIVLGAAVATLFYLSGHYGKGWLTGWGLLVLVVLRFIAEALRFKGRWVAAGIFAFASVIAWGVFVALAWSWFGWLDHWSSAFGGWSIAHLSLEFLILIAAIGDRRHWGFPFITLISALVGWFFVTDFISNGGNWTYVVTLIVGIAYFGAGTISREPSAFWLHLVGGALIGATLLHWWHTSDFDWALISAVAFVYVGIAYATKRSSWAVYATIGFFGATIHYLVGSPTSVFGAVASGTTPPHVSPWAPALAFGLLGFWLVLLGLAGSGRRAVGPVVPPPA
jgi:hypothetical protein